MRTATARPRGDSIPDPALTPDPALPTPTLSERLSALRVPLPAELLIREEAPRGMEEDRKKAIDRALTGLLDKDPKKALASLQQLKDLKALDVAASSLVEKLNSRDEAVRTRAIQMLSEMFNPKSTIGGLEAVSAPMRTRVSEALTAAIISPSAKLVDKFALARDELDQGNTILAIRTLRDMKELERVVLAAASRLNSPIVSERSRAVVLLEQILDPHRVQGGRNLISQRSRENIAVALVQFLGASDSHLGTLILDRGRVEVGYKASAVLTRLYSSLSPKAAERVIGGLSRIAEGRSEALVSDLHRSTAVRALAGVVNLSGDTPKIREYRDLTVKSLSLLCASDRNELVREAATESLTTIGRIRGSTLSASARQEGVRALISAVSATGGKFDIQRRERAMEGLLYLARGSVEGPKAIDCLRSVITSDTHPERRLAGKATAMLLALSQVPSERDRVARTIPTLMDGVSSLRGPISPSVYPYAAKTLGELAAHLGERTPRVVQDLRAGILEALRNPAGGGLDFVASSSALALTKIGAKAVGALPELRAMMEQKRDSWAAIGAMEAILPHSRNVAERTACFHQITSRLAHPQVIPGVGTLGDVAFGALKNLLTKGPADAATRACLKELGEISRDPSDMRQKEALRLLAALK